VSAGKGTIQKVDDEGTGKDTQVDGGRSEPTDTGTAPAADVITSARPEPTATAKPADDKANDDDDKGEEERTNIDAGPPRSGEVWDEGTTVEEKASAVQAVAARAAQRAGGTATDASAPDLGGGIDEPTVEDPARPLPLLAPLPPVVAPSAAPAPAKLPVKPAAKAAAPKTSGARLVVMAGNDTGREFELDLHRTLSVGRAVDNDIVLTDIAVSRRHLDLSHDGQYWVLRDRGSGNGTMVNDRVEDGSCRLYHADRIELGNTVFRFEMPSAPSPSPQLGWGQRDDDEASTVAGARSQRSIETPPTAREPMQADPRPTAPMPRVRPVPDAAKRAALPPPKRGSGAQPVAEMQSADGVERSEEVVIAMPIPAAPRGDDSATVLPLADASGPAPAASSAPVQRAATGRHMTSTALVEPRPFDQPAPPYPFVVKPPSAGKMIAVGVGALLLSAIIGVVAALTSDDDGDAAAVKLPASTWGTDESAIATALPVAREEPTAPAAPTTPAATETPPAPEPAAKPAATETTTPAPTTTPKEPAAEPTTPAPMAAAIVPTREPEPEIEMPAGAAAAARSEPSPSRAAEPTPPRASKPAPRPPRRTATRVEDPEPTPARATPAKSPAAAKKKAQSQYAARDFKGAAATLRAAADVFGPDETESDELTSLADDYDAVGSGITAGNAATASNAVDAMNAFLRAQQSDRRAGGVHAAYLRDRVALVAPKAAASFMAKGNLEMAKRAADTAVTAGAGSSATVVQVRQSLERKAGEIYASAVKIQATKPDDARLLYRRILKIVETTSPWYAKAYRAVNTKP